jgi:hypothetical protein
MGQIILPTGANVTVDEFHGLANLHQLLQDMKNDNYTNNYRISVITAISKLGTHAWSAISYLRELVNQKADNVLLAETAANAIKKIESTSSSNSPILGSRREELTTSVETNKKDVICQVSKRERNNVIIEELKVSDNLDDGTKVYSKCHFCEKVTLANKDQRMYCEKLVGSNKFYCTFCLRNDLYGKAADHIYLLTFRGLIGYYYYCFYAIPRQSTMQLSELNDMISLHYLLAIQNPLWRYDQETFCWFIDFSKIGKSKRKLSVESVLQTVVLALSAFSMYDNIRSCTPHKFYDKYKQGIMDFYNDRIRPKEKILTPTLISCGIPKITYDSQRAIPVDIVKNFLPCNMEEKNYWSRGRR